MIFVIFKLSWATSYEFTSWIIFAFEELIINAWQPPIWGSCVSRVHGKNSVRCVSACLVLRSRCVSLLCIRGLYARGCWGMPSFMLLTNESLRPRLKPAVQQTNSITMTKVGARMQCDKGMVEIKRHVQFTHSHWGQTEALQSVQALVTRHACASHSWVPGDVQTKCNALQKNCQLEGMSYWKMFSGDGNQWASSKVTRVHNEIVFPPLAFLNHTIN